MVLMCAPADDVTANHFSAPSNKPRIGILMSQLPGAICVLDDVCITNVLCEMTHTVIKSHDIRNRQSSFDFNRRLCRACTVKDKQVQPAFAHGFYGLED